MRQAEELSTTTQPASRAMGAYSLETAPPAEKRAMSTPLKRSGDSSRHSTSSPLKASLFPAERSEANGTSSCRGKSRSSSMLNISRPTAPVAPTTATLHFLVNFLPPLPAERAVRCGWQGPGDHPGGGEGRGTYLRLAHRTGQFSQIGAGRFFASLL